MFLYDRCGAPRPTYATTSLHASVITTMTDPPHRTRASTAAAAAAGLSTASMAAATAAAATDNSGRNPTSPSAHIAPNKPPSRKQQRPVDGTDESINPADDTPPRDGGGNLENIMAHTIFVGPEARDIAAAAAAAADGHEHDDSSEANKRLLVPPPRHDCWNERCRPSPCLQVQGQEI